MLISNIVVSLCHMHDIFDTNSLPSAFGKHILNDGIKWGQTNDFIDKLCAWPRTALPAFSFSVTHLSGADWLIVVLTDDPPLASSCPGAEPKSKDQVVSHTTAKMLWFHSLLI